MDIHEPAVLPPRSRRAAPQGWVALVLACGMMSSMVSLSAEIIERVLAIAAGNLIMASDVSAARDLGLVSVESAPDPVRAALSALIDRALVLTEVDRYAPPEPDEDAIAAELGAIRARFKTPERFDATLARAGLDERHLRERLRQDLRIAAYLDQRFTVVQPTDEEVELVFRNDSARFTREGSLMPLDEARAVIVREIIQERRAGRVEEWVAGLRRRAQIVDLY
jgi:hypothetical protein